MRKIRSKIIVSIVLCSVLSILLVGLITSFNYLKVIQGNSKDELKLKSSNTAAELNVTIKEIESSVNALAFSCIEMLDNEDKFFSDEQYLKSYQEKIEPVAKKIAENTGAMAFYIRFNPEKTPATSGLFYADEKGAGSLEKLVPTDFSKYDTEDIEHVGWYYVPVKAGKAVWLNPYFNANINVNMISYVVPLYKNGKTIGVVGMDVNFERIESYVKNTKAYETGYGFLVNEKNDFLSHPTYKIKDNLERVDNGYYIPVTKEIKNNKSGFKQYKKNDVEKIVSYAKLNNDWTFCIAVPSKEVYKGVYNLIKLIISVTIISIAASTMVACYLGNVISKPIVNITKIINSTADFNFADNKDYNFLLDNKDETGIMAKSVGKMREAIRNLVGNIKVTSENSYKNSNKLADIVSDNLKSINETSEVIEEIAAGTTNQAKQAETATKVLFNLAENINSVVNVSNILKEYAENSESVTKEGINTVLDLKNKFENNKEVTHKVSQNVIILNNKSDDVAKILTTIQGIADQTNLLALNASIEAARAGEAGKGFTVVAHEIQKLAEQTSYSAKEIEDIIKEIQREIQITKDSIDMAGVTINDSKYSIEKTNETFESIIKVVKETINNINILMKNVNVINSEKEDALNSIVSIKDISEKFAAATEELSATVQDQVNTFDNISESADELRDVSKNLKESINYFEI
ncbi:methyl-accepting chemotaxis protein McpB [Clostridium acetireducens DSM 10703]|uniref:Methyl-accepting chemotaxis protein McpB n=1 Tax=Clostridium acetireducens DSM 10703 TaxID=1121290 RepID=A0A1E8EVC6_9CLOT|nr:methyl-accepting chemotaxis protein [Clostridium acetireducens]OFH99475.1 methyl-accepting chemotaxis protein McpB [Clostridium acetireducens DSM 10703]